MSSAPSRVSAKIEVALAYEQRSDSAASTVLLGLLEVIHGNLEGALVGTDSECLHDLRVAVRRSRSVQRELRGVFPPARLDGFRREFRWLQQVTGEARDLDVYVVDFDDHRTLIVTELRGELDPLLEVLRRRQAAARARMARALRSDRATRLLTGWSQLLGELEALRDDDRPDAARPIGRLCARRIRKVHRRMLDMGQAIEASSPPEAYHELRKQGKELRYLLELFAAPLHPGEAIGPMIKVLKALQDVLGRHQDRAVQVALLRSLRDEVAARPGGLDAVMAIGALMQSLREDQLVARDGFAQRFAEFQAQHELVATTFA